MVVFSSVVGSRQARWGECQFVEWLFCGAIQTMSLMMRMASHMDEAWKPMCFMPW